MPVSTLTKLTLTHQFVEAFLGRVVVSETTCWNWSGRLDHRGYGTVRVPGQHLRLAHRVSYFMFCGDLLPGKFVLHKCHNRKCVNPEHLRLGTHLENMEDMREAGRNYLGSRSSKSISPELADKMLPLLRDGATPSALASQFGVGFYAVRHLKRKFRKLGML